MSLEAVSEKDWLILTLTVIATLRLFNDVTDLIHTAFATSAISNNNASDFDFFAVFLPLNLLIMHDK